MKYKCGEYITEGGWGGFGVYRADRVVGKEQNRPQGWMNGSVDLPPRDIIPVEAIMAGTGEGWDREAILDNEWLEKATELMNTES